MRARLAAHPEVVRAVPVRQVPDHRVQARGGPAAERAVHDDHAVPMRGATGRRGASASPLHAYPTLEALLAALVGRDKADPDARRRLICAEIAEHQTARGPLGAAIVLHAFRGMLVGLSRSLVGVDDRDEADGLVVAGLLEALGRVRPERDPERIGMYVRQETRRAVFAVLRRSARTRGAPGAARGRRDPGAGGQRGPRGQRDRAGQRGRDRGRRGRIPRGRRRRRRVVRGAAARPTRTRARLATARPRRDRRPRILRTDRRSGPGRAPTVEGILVETLLMAHAVRGGLRRHRSAHLLFADASPPERRRMYQRIVARARLLAALK